MHSLVNWFRFINPLHLIASGCLLFMGMSVVYLSMFGHIQPLWVATLMSMTGSISTMVGAYMGYDIFNRQHQMNSLVKEAIRRVIHSQN